MLKQTKGINALHEMCKNDDTDVGKIKNTSNQIKNKAQNTKDTEKCNTS